MVPAGTRISILIINRNYGQFLKNCLDSALNQTKPAHEIILVDDGSTDDSVAIARSYGGRIRLIQQNSSGIYAAMTRGLEEIVADWVLTLDSDDMILPHCLETVSEVLAEGVSSVYFRLAVTDGEGGFFGCEPEWNAKVPQGDLAGCLEKGWDLVLPPASGNVFSTPVMRKSVQELFSRVNLDNGLFSHDRWVQTVAALEGRSVFIGKVGGYYRIHVANTTGGLFKDPGFSASRIRGHERQAAYVASRLEEKGRPFPPGHLLSRRYSYWWLRAVSWFASNEGRPHPGDTRLFIIRKLLGCVFLGPPGSGVAKLKRIAKILAIALLPRRQDGRHPLAYFEKFERIRQRLRRESGIS